MNILITGANGAVAHELAIDLAKKRNTKIICIGRNIKKLISKDNIEYLEHNLLKPIKYSKTVDVCIHAASNHYFSNPKVKSKQLFDENLLISQNIANFCNKKNVKKLIFFSSIDVYGTPNKKRQVFNENNKLRLENWYSRSKIKSEKIFKSKYNKFKSICLRVPGILTYQKFRNFPVTLKHLHEARLNKDINIFNPKEKFNNLIDVTELKTVILKIISLNLNSNITFNLAASKPIEYQKVIKKIIKLFKSNSKIISIKKQKKSFLISNDYVSKILNLKISSTEEIISRVCKKIKANNTLAIFGSKPHRIKKMPPRKVFENSELNMVKKVFKHSWKTGVDFGFQGKFEDKFTKEFSNYHGGGYADAVSSGGAALYIALKSLDLEPGSHVIVSPTCNPGGIMPLAIQNIKMIIPDSKKNSFNISPEEFKKCITPKTKAAVLTHLGGHPIDMDPIMKIAKRNKIKIVEDCSQAHGATYKGKKVGTFGDIAAFSNGYSKQLAAGGTAGIIYTKHKSLYWKSRSIADRGKPFEQPNFNFRMTTNFLFPSHNLNADEISCAIGTTVLKKLPSILNRRHRIVEKLNKKIRKECSIVYDTNLEPKNCRSSYFFHTLGVDLNKITTTKIEFARAIASEGILINYDYRDITSEWKWTSNYTVNFRNSYNAINFRDRTFNLLFNERYNERI